jgi:lipopolysaccharide/colanic/teichoic acid biosynthesis glycosyltransferase
MQLPNRALESSDLSALAFPIAVLPPAIQVAPDRETRIKSPSASDWSLSGSKRLFDLSVALLVLALFALPMLAVALGVRFSSRGPAFFVQQRVGRWGHLFRICKFRTMTFGSDKNGPTLTMAGDRRITALGRWLRRLKIDELPQFYNVLRGEMSLVGPRPKLPQYEAIVNMPYRPGITGAATLAFRREEEMLSHLQPSQLDSFYNRHIRQLKARIDARYMCRASFWSDMRLICVTFLSCLVPARAPFTMRSAPPPQILTFPTQPLHKSSAASSFETLN